MKFKLLSKPPAPRERASLPPSNHGVVSLSIPSPIFFTSDHRFWLDKYREAKRGNNEFVATISRDLAMHIGELLTSSSELRSRLKNELGGKGTHPMHPGTLTSTIRWLLDAHGIMAGSRFLSDPAAMPLIEINPKDEDGDLQVSLERLKHFTFEAHLDDAFMKKLNLTPLRQGERRWYEGDSVFVEARRPAKPNHVLRREKRIVNPAAYTSFFPVLKHSAWPPPPPLPDFFRNE